MKWGAFCQGLPWQPRLFCCGFMILCLFCVWTHGSVLVCVCHVLLMFRLLDFCYQAPFFSPRLVLVSLIVLTWSSCSLVPLYCASFPHVFAGLSCVLCGLCLCVWSILILVVILTFLTLFYWPQARISLDWSQWYSSSHVFASSAWIVSHLILLVCSVFSLVNKTPYLLFCIWVLSLASPDRTNQPSVCVCVCE